MFRHFDMMPGGRNHGALWDQQNGHSDGGRHHCRVRSGGPGPADPVAAQSRRVEATGTYSIGNKSIPLPDGVWTVIGTQIVKDGGRGFQTAHMLARIEDKTVQSAVEVYTNIAIRKSAPGGAANQGWLTDQNCTRDNMHFAKVHANVRLGEQDCWWVNHWRMHRSGGGNTEHWMESRKYLADNRIEASLDMVAVSYRLANKVDYLTLNYFFNPEISGFEAEKNIHWSIHTWETSAWHPDQTKENEKKQAYIEDLISWGKAWRIKVKALFDTK